MVICCIIYTDYNILSREVLRSVAERTRNLRLARAAAEECGRGSRARVRSALLALVRLCSLGTALVMPYGAARLNGKIAS